MDAPMPLKQDIENRIRINDVPCIRILGVLDTATGT